MVGLFSGCSELDSTSGSICGHVSVTSMTSSVQGKISGDTHVDFLVCSSFPPLNNQIVVEFPVDWVAPLYRSRRQKLAVQSHTPTLLHINRRDEDSLRDRI